jgi:hypothetical protein
MHQHKGGENWEYLGHLYGGFLSRLSCLPKQTMKFAGISHACQLLQVAMTYWDMVELKPRVEADA